MGHDRVLQSEGYRSQTARMVFDRAPMLVYWELTRACDLACRHCRAEAMDCRHPDELSAAEILEVLDGASAFGRPLPHVVFTGGDPLKREDLFDVLSGTRSLGYGVSLAPSGTPLLTRDAIDRLAGAGIQTISLSLDGSSAGRHDSLRGVPGCFARTIAAAQDVRAAGIPLQINTLVTEETAGDLRAVYDLVATLDITRWSLFFLIGTGRGRALREVPPARAERIFQWLFDLGRNAPFAIKTTEATHYRRIAVNRLRQAGLSEEQIARTPEGRGFGIRDGNGILFISHTGDVYPSGFLPIVAGNVRQTPLVDLYREGDVFRRLRDVHLLKGKCGACEYTDLCGGSRARAYARTGDEMASDPLCPYVPSAVHAAIS